EMLRAQQEQLEKRQVGLNQLHCSLEGRQTRMAAAALEWDAERTRVLAGAQSREDSATARLRRLGRLCRRAFHHQREQIAALEKARGACEETRQQYAVLWEECRARIEELMHEQQGLAAEALALEQLRLEILGRADDAAA